MARRLEPINRLSLRDRVVGAIRDAVVRGAFRPGEKVPESELAEQLGVSRTPVREALRILEHQGLVVTRPKNGTYIARLDRRALHNGLLVRTSLEQLALQQAMDQLGADAWGRICDELDALLADMRRAVASGDDAVATEIDGRFHELLVSSPGNPQLVRAWYAAGSSTLVWSAEVDRYPLRRSDWLAAVRQHAELVQVFRTRDVERCRSAIAVHIMGKLGVHATGMPGTPPSPAGSADGPSSKGVISHVRT